MAICKTCGKEHHIKKWSFCSEHCYMHRHDKITLSLQPYICGSFAIERPYICSIPGFRWLARFFV